MNRICNHCNAQMPEGTPGNRCPKCLLGLGLADEPTDVDEHPSETSSERIGRYKLLQQIGEGGCGIVYMAEQEEPVRRRVALKVIKLGMDTKNVVARFEAERQALALMDHPNIARVFDGGATEQGRPFFVMELVRGIKITDYCDQHELPMRERLDLFIQVCHAVQHAHQKGIIHRDLKPSNILVTVNDGVAVPKVIDFGVAKATEQRLTDKTIFTAFHAFVGTPAYMSPEQAEMSSLDIDTRSDVYSLGVLLYELLAGQTPFDHRDLVQSGIDEMRRTIREKEPQRPSTRLGTLSSEELTTTAKHRRTDAPRLISYLRGDLDWIVMTCLEKDRTRRYDTANALANDIQRHLNHEPVLACPPSSLYQFQKLVQRNKLVFAAVASVAAALICGLGFSTWLYGKERMARQRAVAAEAKAQTQATHSAQVAQFLKDMLEAVGPSKARGRDTTMLREILDRTAQRVTRDLASQPDVQIELWITLAETYHELGNYDDAEKLARQALELARTRYGEEHLATARALVAVGYAIYGRGHAAQPEALIRQALTIQRRLIPPGDARLVDTLDKLADAVWNGSKHADAEHILRESIAIKRKLFGGKHPALPRSLNIAAALAHERGDTNRAEALFREALALSEELGGREHPEAAAALALLGKLLRDNEDLAQAETVLREALARQTKVLGQEHPHVANTLSTLASILNHQNKLGEAETLYRQALAIKRKALGDLGFEVVFALRTLAEFFESHTNHAGLAGVFATCRELAERGNPEAYYELGRMYSSGLGVAVDAVQSTNCYLRARDMYRQQAASGSASTQPNMSIASMYHLGRGVAKDVNEAAKWYRAAIQQGNVPAQEALGSIYYWHGGEERLSEAIQLFRSAAEQNVAKAAWHLGHAYQNGKGVAKDPVQALDWYRKAAATGDASAQRALGQMYAMGEGMAEKDPSAAAGWYLKAAKQGDAKAQERLAQMHAQGQWIPKNEAEARKWFSNAAEHRRKAAEGGDVAAQESLARMYAKGEWVPTDEAQSVYWYRQALEHHRKCGDAEGMNNVAWILATAIPVAARDGRTAVEFAEKAVSATSRTNGNYIDTLAAAYAELGDFERAVALQKEAVAAPHMQAVTEQFKARVKLYESNTPYRERVD